MEIARKKVEATNTGYSSKTHVTRHALDMFSLRFLHFWIDQRRENPQLGFASFVVKMADEAWVHGVKHRQPRHKDDGITKEYKDIVWVFVQSAEFPEYLEVITCYPMDDADDDYAAYVDSKPSP